MLRRVVIVDEITANFCWLLLSIFLL